MKNFFLRLKTTLLYKNLLDNYHFIVIGLAIIGLIYIHSKTILLFIFPIYLFYLFFYNKKLFIATIIILSLFILGLITKEIGFKNRILGEKALEMTVVERKEIENGYRLIVRNKNYKYQLNTKELYSIGDVLIIKGTFIDIDSNHIPSLFNYQDYCKYQGIYGKIIDYEIQRIDRRFVLLNMQMVLFKYYDKHFSLLSTSYLKALVLGDKSNLDPIMLDNINSIGISHLFVVSGLHVTLLIGMIERILSKVSKNNKMISWLTIIILFFYMWITNFMISVIRVVFSFVTKEINNRYHLNLSSLDILSIVTIFVLIINPYYLFNGSFILSFGMTYALIIGSKLLNSKGFLRSLFKMSIYCQVIGLPLSYNFSNRINIFSVIFNMLFVPFVSYIFLPFSLLVSFFPFLDKIYKTLIYFFEALIFLSKKFSIYIVLPKINIELVCLLLILLYYFFKQIETKRIKRWLIGALMLHLFIWTNYGVLNIYDQIVFFDLPNGESTLIRKAFNQYNILIDTGDVTEEDNNSIVQYLHKQGIKKLDYVIITHSDSDHIGGLETIMKQIKVKNIITNYYEKEEIFNRYLKYNKKLKIYYLKADDYFKYYNISFNCLSPNKDLGDVNNNSLVFLLKIDDFKILFTGDIEGKAEKTINQSIECDLLKVAHHGSKTSTSLEFLEKVKFDSAIIMNGYHNIFDFPSSVVINRLKNYQYYITGFEKTIIYQKPFFIKKFKKC